MKTKILTLAVCVIVTLVIYSCNIRWDETKLNNTVCLNYPEPISQLPVQLVHDMINGYKDNQLTNINTSMGMDDAHSIWFDLETLKRFVYHIETTTKKVENNISSKDLGIRIYYASYPEDMIDKDVYNGELQKFIKNHQIAQNFGKLHTLLMVPTIKRDSMHIDFNPLDSITYTTSMKRLEKYLSNSSDSTVVLSSSRSTTPQTPFNPTNSLNHGSLIPPGDPIVEGF